MSTRPSDGWLWASLALLGYFGSLAVHRQLVAIRQASEVTRHDKRPNINQQTEDALKLEALAELTQSPDQNIRAASVKIITDRVIREGPTWDMLIRDIAGADSERRDTALACLRFLCPSFSGNKQANVVISRHSTYKAIVDCLCNLLPEAQKAEKDPAFRTQAERNAVYILDHILGFDIAKALEAGVIRRWLAQYPFGGENASEYKKKKAIMAILDNGPFNADSSFRCAMRAVLWFVSNNPCLRKEMVEHGLLDVPKGNDIIVDDDQSVLEASPLTRLQTERMHRALPVGTSSRPREESFEEQALRRRRREAMVLGEVGRPIERADIIERDSTTVDGFQPQVLPSQLDETEEETEQPVDAVADEDLNEELESSIEEVNHPSSITHRGGWSWLTRLRPDGLAREPA